MRAAVKSLPKSELFLVGCTVFSQELASVKWLPLYASIFTTELRGVDMTVQYIQNANINKSVIFVDSQSVLSAVCSRHATKNTLVELVRLNVMDSVCLGKSIVFSWVLSHMGIYGNEQADQLAPSSHTLEQTTVSLPFQDCYVQFRTAVKLAWQKE